MNLYEKYDNFEPDYNDPKFIQKYIEEFWKLDTLGKQGVLNEQHVFHESSNLLRLLGRAIRNIAKPGGGTPNVPGTWTPSMNAPGLNTGGGRGNIGSGAIPDGGAGGGGDGPGFSIGSGTPDPDDFMIIKWPGNNMILGRLLMGDPPDYWNLPAELWGSYVAQLLRSIVGILDSLNISNTASGASTIHNIVRQFAEFVLDPSSANLVKLNELLDSTPLGELGWMIRISDDGFIRLEFLPTLPEGMDLDTFLDQFMDNASPTLRALFDILVEMQEFMNSVGIPE